MCCHGWFIVLESMGGAWRVVREVGVSICWRRFPVRPLTTNAAAVPARRRDAQAAIEVHRADAEAVVAKGLEWQWAESCCSANIAAARRLMVPRRGRSWGRAFARIQCQSNSFQNEHSARPSSS